MRVEPSPEDLGGEPGRITFAPSLAAGHFRPNRSRALSPPTLRTSKASDTTPPSDGDLSRLTEAL